MACGQCGRKSNHGQSAYRTRRFVDSRHSVSQLVNTRTAASSAHTRPGWPSCFRGVSTDSLLAPPLTLPFVDRPVIELRVACSARAIVVVGRPCMFCTIGFVSRVAICASVCLDRCLDRTLSNMSAPEPRVLVTLGWTSGSP